MQPSIVTQNQKKNTLYKTPQVACLSPECENIELMLDDFNSLQSASTWKKRQGYM